MLQEFNPETKTSPNQGNIDLLSADLKAQCHLLSDVILRLRKNTIIMNFDRYLSCLGIKVIMFWD